MIIGTMRLISPLNAQHQGSPAYSQFSLKHFLNKLVYSFEGILDYM